MNRKQHFDPRAWRDADPHSEQEQQRYGQAVPARDWILQTLSHADGPRTYNHLVDLLGLTDDDPLDGFSHRLSAMVRDGQLVQNRRGGYGIPQEMSLVAGRVLAHKDGFGFLTPDDGSGDLFLPPQQMQRLWPGDRVVVRASEADHRGRREAVVVEVLERGVTQVVGRYRVEHGVGMISPENPRIRHDVLVPDNARGDAREGQIVVADIISDPQPRKPPVGRVVEVLGEHMGPGMEIEAAIRAHGIPHVFPDAALDQAESLPDTVRDADARGRKDVRKLPLVTIDGEDARDFDDAVHARRTFTGWKLYVAIADVDAYVPSGSPLDEHARERGNSVYFPDQVVPMLPEKISNGLCSLMPKVDRLCMVCEMQIRRNGELVRGRFYEAVMRSHARLTYTQVAEALDSGRMPEGEDPGLIKQVRELDALYGALAKARARRGTVAFETGETRFLFDAEQKIERIVPVTRNRAHVIVEECMIAANVSAARYVRKHKRGALYRVHANPAPEKIQVLREFLGTRALTLGGGDSPTSADFQAVMEQAEGRPDQPVIQSMMLRAMMQARYSPECDGHFGLALDEYAHFTSPIRRYPDLVLHRAIKRVLHGVSKKDEPIDHPGLEALGAACSTTERRADEATRDVALWLKCEYMQQHVGDQFEGTITGIAPFGIFVTLDSIHVEGLVHVTALDNDYYEHDPVQNRLTGRRGGHVYAMGDSLRVQVARVSLDERKIDLEPAAKPAEAPAPSGGAPAAKKRSRRRGSGGRGRGQETASQDVVASGDEAIAKNKRRGQHGGAATSAPSGDAVTGAASAKDKPANSAKKRSRRRRGSGKTKPGSEK